MNQIKRGEDGNLWIKLKNDMTQIKREGSGDKYV